jgi:hypothetical protein
MNTLTKMREAGASDSEIKKRALEICLELWEWLADEDGRQKYGWPGWAEHGDMLHNCPCCEEAHPGVHEDDFEAENCNACLLWPGQGRTACEKAGSPYAEWLTSDDASDAREMVRYIRRRMDA